MVALGYLSLKCHVNFQLNFLFHLKLCHVKNAQLPMKTLAERDIYEFAQQCTIPHGNTQYLRSIYLGLKLMYLQ